MNWSGDWAKLFRPTSVFDPTNTLNTLQNLVESLPIRVEVKAARGGPNPYEIQWIKNDMLKVMCVKADVPILFGSIV